MKIDELSAEIEKGDRRIGELAAELEEYKGKCIEEHSKCIFLPSTNTPLAFGFQLTSPLIIYLLLCIFRERGRKNGKRDAGPGDSPPPPRPLRGSEEREVGVRAAGASRQPRAV
ncbi:PREDICTED: uncharacterized protein LOC103898521 [Aptenodytes forsteri]|uniref:uncharacterized protein LOC103898521 n=1 Tax=Aptenodytes forsteri TaxID=9233 RepID=UPI000904CFD3|nr:PREDICTED: uncharacterized protein LOC103898521 [Aptenodytes forsteri]